MNQSRHKYSFQLAEFSAENTFLVITQIDDHHSGVIKVDLLPISSKL